MVKHLEMLPDVLVDVLDDAGQADPINRGRYTGQSVGDWGFFGVEPRIDCGGCGSDPPTRACGRGSTLPCRSPPSAAPRRSRGHARAGFAPGSADVSDDRSGGRAGGRRRSDSGLDGRLTAVATGAASEVDAPSLVDAAGTPRALRAVELDLAALLDETMALVGDVPPVERFGPLSLLANFPTGGLVTFLSRQEPGCTRRLGGSRGRHEPRAADAVPDGNA